MSTVCFTSITFSYLNRARVLGRSLRKFHPDWKLVLCLTDKTPPGFVFDLAQEPYDRVLYADELGIADFPSWLFKMNVVEACTAVKGPVIDKLLSEGAQRVFYLDPDTAVFNSLQPLVDELGPSAVLLTPHQLAPDDDYQAIIDNEICSLAHGAYNLGFVAVHNDPDGRAFARWWRDRCLEFCYDEKSRGLFVDQKWCDLAPALFDRVRILRDPGYNVASWNLSRRRISFTADGECRVNERFPLRFFHFTKLGPIGDTMTRRYAKDNVEVFELWAWYKRQIAEVTDARIPERYWFYGVYSDGAPISEEARHLYRHRKDLQVAFPDPFHADGYKAWWEAETSKHKPAVAHA